MKKLLCLSVMLLSILLLLASCTHTHKFGEWMVTKNPTCTEDGTQSRYCDCGEEQHSAIPAPGHTQEIIPAVNPTCTTSGSTEGKKCSKCGEVIVEPTTLGPIEHKLETKTEKDETCKVYTITYCTDDSCTHKTKEFLKVEHGFGEWSLVSETDNTTSSCGVDKLYARTCGDCGQVEEKTEFAEGHDWEEYEYPAIEKCQYSGCYDLLLRKCVRCGAEDVRRGEGHIDSDWIVKTEATCTTDGSKYIQCLRGGDILKEEVIPAPGHTPGAEATCETAQTCVNCEYVYVPALGHNYVNDKCDRCGEKLVLEAGLYDADNNLLASWDELVNVYGLDVEKDYSISNSITTVSSLSYMLNNYPEFKSATKLIMSNEILRVGDFAFAYCKFTLVEIPDSVTYIGKSAFYYCSNLISVEIPDSVTYIGNSAFSTCKSIASIIIGKSVISIGDSAFSGCSNLVSVAIPNSVTTINRCAFQQCTSLSSVVIPDSVTNIGDDVFSGCISLQYNKYNNCQYLGNESNPYYAFIDTDTHSSSSYTINEYTKIIASGAFANCTYVNSIVIPDGVIHIGELAFYNCESLTSVEIPDSVITIGSGAFSNCRSLASLVVPDSVITIGHYTFQYCDKLISVVIGNGVTTIGEDAFKHCDGLTSVVIGNSVTNISDDAFDQCSHLLDVYYTGTEEEWQAITINYYNGNGYLRSATKHYNYVPEE